MLEITGLSICRNEFQISLPRLYLAAGQILGLKGNSGCGKSTLLEIIGLILKPTELASYRLQMDGQWKDMTIGVSTQDQVLLAPLRTRAFGFMLQTGGLFPFLTVGENIALTNQLLGIPPDQHWLDYLVDNLQVRAKLSAYPKQLSVGERQRVAFIRSIAHKPAVLLADEPTAALDPDKAQTLIELISQCVHEQGISALIVSHDWDLLARNHIDALTATTSDHQSIFQ